MADEAVRSEKQARVARGPAGRPRHGQCILFMAGKACLGVTCTGSHLDKERRPACQAFGRGQCPWLDGSCWFPHVTDYVELPPHELVIQITGSSATRFCSYLSESFPGRLLSEPSVMRAAGLCRSDDQVVFVHTDDQAHIIRGLASDLLVAHVAKRWYVPNVRSRSFEEAIAAISSQIVTHCERASVATAALRVQCYPREDEELFMDRLMPSAERGASSLPPPCKSVALSLSPTDWDFLVTCVHVGGWWCTGIERSDGDSMQPWGHMAAKRTDVEKGAEVVCRAHYKLQEALCRTGYVTHPRMGLPQSEDAAAEVGAAMSIPGVPSDSKRRGRGPGPTHVPIPQARGGEGAVHVDPSRGWTPRVGLDIGASPGGWTQFMLHLGMETVFAVDPGDLSSVLPLAPTGAVRHLRQKALTAIADLVALPEHASTVDLYACDMNCECPDTIAALRAARPLLAPGCVIVLTLKNFCGSKRRWEATCRDAVSAVEGITNSRSVWMMHLMSNGATEVTLVARLAAPPESPLDAAGREEDSSSAH